MDHLCNCKDGDKNDFEKNMMTKHCRWMTQVDVFFLGTACQILMDFLSFSSTAKSINLTILQIFLFLKLLTRLVLRWINLYLVNCFKACTDCRLN